MTADSSPSPADEVRPQDDLFRHVNGPWIAATPIPDDKASYGSFHQLAENAENAVHAIAKRAVSAEPGTTERKIGDLFTSFMDVDRINERGAEPIQADLARAEQIGSIAELLTTLGALERGGTSGFAQLFVDNDPGNPERYLIMVEQSGLGLPDESYFREEHFAEVRDSYRAHLERMFTLAGLSEPGERAARVFDLETRIAAAHWDNVASRDSEKTYNLVTWAEALETAGVDLELWRAGIGIEPEKLSEIVVRQPSFLTGLGELLTEDNLDAWRDWLSWQVIRSSASLLSEEFVEANFDFYGRTLSGVPQLRARWKRGVGMVESVLGEAVGEIYVAQHFKPEAKEAMDDLVAHLVEAYRRSIIELDWMTEATRARALEKLALFTPKVGYPEKWRDYASLEIGADDLIANSRAAAEFEFQREVGKIGRPLDRDEWFMTPQTVNAYYNPGFNEIVFPAAILQLPFFEQGRDAAENYGAIGAVIGHEIGHGFDDQGSRFDGTGKLTDWWTAEDRAAFEERTGSLIAQYNALEPQQTPGHHVNGELTIGENIGDLGGLGIAWQAYLISLNPEDPSAAVPPVIDGVSAAQRFLFAWAESWRTVSRDEQVIQYLAIDPHSPPEFRCNQIVRNLDLFYEAFDVQPGDQLWLDPAERVTIW